MKTIFKKKGDVILKEGEETNNAYIILEGSIEVTKKGRKVATLLENNIFGEIAMVDNRPRTATCTALTPCKLGQVSREDYITLLKHRPEAINPLLRVVTERLRNLTDMLQDMSSIK